MIKVVMTTEDRADVPRVVLKWYDGGVHIGDVTLPHPLADELHAALKAGNLPVVDLTEPRPDTYVAPL